MIQRIQSILLLLVSVGAVLMFFLDFAEISIKGDIFIYNYTGIHITAKPDSEFNQHTVIISIFLMLISILSFLSIFLFKKRRIQIKLCSLIILLEAGLMVVIYIYIFKISAVLTTVTYQPPVIFPLVSVILLILAIRSIRKDENLVRSLDRIR